MAIRSPAPIPLRNDQREASGHKQGARRHSRRQFLRGAAVAGAGLLILPASRSAFSFAANEKVDVALIGVGGRGSWYVERMPAQANVVALCDVNESKAQAAFQAMPHLPRYHDYRRLLDEMATRIDGVMIATPDHTHAVISAAALRAGKHVFCEKPLTGAVHEARVLRELAAARPRQITRMGNQGSASPNFRRGVELIEDGVIGEIREAYVWCAGSHADAKEAPREQQPIPPYLKWDLWLGPNADRPFNSRWLSWNTWREFGTGLNGNRGSHSGYMNFYALNIIELWHSQLPASQRPKIRVSAQTSGINRLSFPRWEIVHLHIPARGALPPLTIHWYCGQNAPGFRQTIEDRLGRKADWGDAGENRWNEYEGALLVGSKGTIYAKNSNNGLEVLPAEKFASTSLRPTRLANSPGMPEPEWLGAIRGQKVHRMSPFEVAGPYTEMMLLGNVATQFDEELEYDPVEGRITNNAQADACLYRPYRAGWSL